MATALKTKPGVPALGAASIPAHDQTEALRGAQYRFERRLHDLPSEFIAGVGKLREQYLAEVAEISNGEEAA